MPQRITKIEYNWHVGPYGESVYSHVVGVSGVERIEEHRSLREEDKWYYDVTYNDGKSVFIFNPNKVYFEKK